MTVNLGFLLHAYQPWWQFPNVLKKITEEAYKPNFTKLCEDSRYRMTLNINFALVELFENNNFNDLTDLVQHLIESERIEITSSSAYHAFLPLVTKDQVELQIEIQQERMKELFENYNPKGFFLPEMGYNEGIEKILLKKGFEWTITDDPPFIEHHNQSPPYNWVPQINGFSVLQRSKTWSYDKIAKNPPNGNLFLKEVEEGFNKWTNGDDAYLVVAFDFETLNHHHPNTWDKFFGEIVDNIGEYGIKLVTISDIISKFPKKEIYIPKGSWSTSREQYSQGEFYPLWQGRNNELHRLLWLLYTLAEESTNNNSKAKHELAKGVNSCTWWQAPMGNPHLVYFGVEQMKHAIEVSGNNILQMQELSQRIYSLVH